MSPQSRDKKRLKEKPIKTSENFQFRCWRGFFFSLQGTCICMTSALERGESWLLNCNCLGDRAVTLSDVCSYRCELQLLLAVATGKHPGLLLLSVLPQVPLLQDVNAYLY